MSKQLDIDTSFDIRSDAKGRDPDKFSPTLRRYHRQLWSKPLPNGVVFELADQRSKGYLRHDSSVGAFRVASDQIIRTFDYSKRLRHIVEHVPPQEREAFVQEACTIGGTIIFPKKFDRRHTLNQARGVRRSIEDRFDLTLECIRRHYGGEASPLGDVLDRYADFFDLFGGFRQYSEFFLLEDLVTGDFSAVRFLTEWDGFSSPALPSSLDEYMTFRDRSVAFVRARNQRIAQYVYAVNARVV